MDTMYTTTTTTTTKTTTTTITDDSYRQQQNIKLFNTIYLHDETDTGLFIFNTRHSTSF